MNQKSVVPYPVVARWVLWLAILIGIAFKFYGINDHWKNHDHYNYGGAYMTAATRCLKQTPLSVSHGIPHTHCEKDTKDYEYYPNHPPTILFGLWAMTDFLGDHEWVYRLFTLIFSVLNVYLIFLVAREVWPEDDRPYYAAIFQTFFLGNIYFATHIDFIGEHTISWILLVALFALRGRMWLAPLCALAAGLTSWPGYISFGPLFLYCLIVGRGKKRTFFLGAFGFCVALGTMMWLTQAVNIAAFFMKRVNPDYLKHQKTAIDIFIPFKFLKNVIQSHSRLLSPLFCIFAFYELIHEIILPAIRRGVKRLKTDRLLQAVLLVGGTGFIYSLVGFQFVMIHVFLFLLFTPVLAICCANFVTKLFAGKTPGKKWIYVLGLLFLIFYPYGIFQSSLAHDIFNSSLFVLTALYFMFAPRMSSKAIMILVAIAGFANFSQTTNYRNEPDTEYPFCEMAREQYKRTGRPVETREPWTMTKDLVYCVGIPIVYK